MAHKDNFIYTSLSLPKNVRAAVDQLAYAQDRSVNKVCVDLIRRGLAATVTPAPATSNVPKAGDK